MIPKLMTFAGAAKYLRSEQGMKPMKQPIIVLEPKHGQPGFYVLCISIYGDNMDRLQHEDYTLSLDDLWTLKRQVDRELLEARKIQPVGLLNPDNL